MMFDREVYVEDTRFRTRFKEQCGGDWYMDTMEPSREDGEGTCNIRRRQLALTSTLD